MSKYQIGSQVRDIRNGKYHIIIDNETFDDLSLYYTSGGTSVPEYFLISTDKTVLSSLFERQQNNEVITEWLRENTELKDIVPEENFDFDKFLKDFLDKNTKRETLWDKVSQFFFESCLDCLINMLISLVVCLSVSDGSIFSNKLGSISPKLSTSSLDTELVSSFIKPIANLICSLGLFNISMTGFKL